MNSAPTPATRLFDIMVARAAARPTDLALSARTDGKWRAISTEETMAAANRISAGLQKLGIKKGERVAIISGNRPEWIFSDLGIMQIGAVVVPLYPAASDKDYEYILKHSGARVVFVSTGTFANRVRAMRANLPDLVEIISFDPAEGFRQWSELSGESVDRKAIEEARASMAPSDLATIVYTSGTTGTPKGVMLTHACILANVTALVSIVPAQGVTRSLSFLPLCHVFERAASYYYQKQNIGIHFAESVDTIARDLGEVRPQMFTTVPRLLEKLYERLEAKTRELKGIKRKLAAKCLAFGLAFDPEKEQGFLGSLSLALSRRILLNKWRTAMGGEVRFIISGGSALQPRLARIFWSAGIKVLEGYGLTETSPVIACNSPTHCRIGTVGRPLPNLEVKILPGADQRPGEGEIVARGPSVMPGYFSDAAATSAIVDEDGWFHTGDVGRIDQDGFLAITDRIKEMFKTSGGKFIAPMAIESKLKESIFVGQVMVIGENRKFPAALIVPERSAVEKHFQELGSPVPTGEAFLRDKAVLELYRSELERLCMFMGKWERIKSFRLIGDVWGIDTGEMTPKLSLRRRVLMARYQALVEDIYANADQNAASE